MTFTFLAHIFSRDVAHEYFALVSSIYENGRVLTKRSRGMRASSMPVKDSRGSGAIAEFPHPLTLVFSSLKDRSSPRDPLVSHGKEPPGASLSTGARQVYIFIDFDYEPISLGNPRTQSRGRGDSFLSRTIDRFDRENIYTIEAMRIAPSLARRASQFTSR